MKDRIVKFELNEGCGVRGWMGNRVVKFGLNGGW